MTENPENPAVSEITKTPKESSWWNLIKALWRRFTEPFSSVIFICIFLAVVVIVGGLGFWIPLFSVDRNSEGFTLLIATSLATYFMAIVATVFADLSFALFEKLLDRKNHLKDNKPISTEVALWAFVFLFSVIVIILGVVSLVKKTDQDTVFYLSILGTIIALFLWWIVNSDNKKLKESTFDAPQYNAGNTIDSNLSGQGVKDGTATF